MSVFYAKLGFEKLRSKVGDSRQIYVENCRSVLICNQMLQIRCRVYENGFECLVLPIFLFLHLCVCVFASAFVFPAVGPHFHDWDICHFASATGGKHQDLHHCIGESEI